MLTPPQEANVNLRLKHTPASHKYVIRHLYHSDAEFTVTPDLFIRELDCKLFFSEVTLGQGLSSCISKTKVMTVQVICELISWNEI